MELPKLARTARCLHYQADTEGITMLSDEFRNGLLEFYHRLDCAHCARVRDFITSQKLQAFIHLHDVEAEDGSIDRLHKLSGRKEVPCLVVEGSALFEYDHIIRWLEVNMAQNRPPEAMQITEPYLAG
jgi:glutaredoxin 3